eukprot:scaffold4690_cov116-Cylindrotheca_fusiformis.AAC.9
MMCCGDWIGREKNDDICRGFFCMDPVPKIQIEILSVCVRVCWTSIFQATVEECRYDTWENVKNG